MAANRTAIRVRGSNARRPAKRRSTFQKNYPDDHRLMMGEVLGMTLVDAERDARDPSAPLQPKRVEFLKERENVSDLQREAREADSAVDVLRARIEAAVTDEERRAALAAASTRRASRIRRCRSSAQPSPAPTVRWPMPRSVTATPLRR
jgi:hypothetical protein